MDDRVLAMCELSNDLLFHKIPKERLSDYIDASLAVGREVARSYAGQDIQELYASRNIQIKYAGSGKGSYGVILRGQSVMSEQGCSVELYQDSIAELALHSFWRGRSLSNEEALRVHLAHEFFHIWEYQEHRSIVDELPGIESFRFWKLKRISQINRCGEIAAHAFAKELLGLPFLPNFYDYLYLIGTGKMTQSAFEELTERMEDLLSSSNTVN